MKMFVLAKSDTITEDRTDVLTEWSHHGRPPRGVALRRILLLAIASWLVVIFSIYSIFWGIAKLV